MNTYDEYLSMPKAMLEIAEDAADAVAAWEAYNEYVKSGCKSIPVEDFLGGI